MHCRAALVLHSAVTLQAMAVHETLVICQLAWASTCLGGGRAESASSASLPPSSSCTGNTA